MRNIFNPEDKIQYDDLSPSLQAMIDEKASGDEFLKHSRDDVIHIIQSEREYWNSVEGICKEYTEKRLKEECDNVYIKITQETNTKLDKMDNDKLGKGDTAINTLSIDGLKIAISYYGPGWSEPGIWFSTRDMVTYIRESYGGDWKAMGAALVAK